MLKSLFLSTTDPGGGNFTRDELISLSEKLPTRLRHDIAKYLRSAPMLLPWMELTDDLIEGKFRVAGGSAVNSDGVYYWRLDTADYVETYGIAIPLEFIEHVRAQNWTPPELDDLEYRKYCDEIKHIMKTYSQEFGAASAVQIFYPTHWKPDDPRRQPEP